MTFQKNSRGSNLYPSVSSGNSGFTLLEIMIVVAILATLITIAVPSYVRQRNYSVMAAISNDMKTYAGAVDVYQVEHSGYPADTTNTFPNELKAGNYLDDDVSKRYDYGTQLPLIGGNYDWDNNSSGSPYTAAIALANIVNPDQALLEIVDNNLDDGNLSSKRIYKTGNNLIYLMEE